MFLVINIFLLASFWFLLCFFIFLPNLIRLVLYYLFNFFFCFIIFLNIFYNKSIYWYQYVLTFYKSLFFNIELTWGFDILSLNLILLSSFLLVFCFLSYWNLKYKSIYYFFILNFSLWILVNVFSSLDFFFFFYFLS